MFHKFLSIVLSKTLKFLLQSSLVTTGLQNNQAHGKYTNAKFSDERCKTLYFIAATFVCCYKMYAYRHPSCGERSNVKCQLRCNIQTVV